MAWNSASGTLYARHRKMKIASALAAGILKQGIRRVNAHFTGSPSNSFAHQCTPISSSMRGISAAKAEKAMVANSEPFMLLLILRVVLGVSLNTAISR